MRVAVAAEPADHSRQERCLEHMAAHIEEVFPCLVQFHLHENCAAAGAAAEFEESKGWFVQPNLKTVC